MRCGRPLPAGRACTIALSAGLMNLHGARHLPRQRHPHRVRRPIPSSAPARSLSRIRSNVPAAAPTFRALPTNAAIAGIPDLERGPRIVSPSMKGDAVQKCHLTLFEISLKFLLPLPRPVGRLRFRRPILSWGMVVRADPSCLPLGPASGPHASKTTTGNAGNTGNPSWSASLG